MEILYEPALEPLYAEENKISSITRVRMWTPKSKAVFWVIDPIRGVNYRWSQKDLYKVIWDKFIIGGLR